ncbi:MAG: glycosyltransferase [Clostridia bacterium]|nr:glycosyltransferase [Clostridia bacterium]
MKKVLIVGQDMFISGVSRAQLGLLHAFDKEKYKVDLFLRNHEGEFLKYIPDDVTLLPEKKAYRCVDMTTVETLKQGRIFQAFGKAYGMVKAKSYAKKHGVQLSAVALDYTHKHQKRFLPMISKEEYDLVISFVAPHYFGAYKCRAKKRLSWIHTDYSLIDIDAKSEEKVWGLYDGIASISDSVGIEFSKKLPTLKDKIVRIDNPISPSLIRRSADEGQSEMAKDGIRIVSCGTLAPGKNFRSIPKMVSILLNEGLDVKWYIIGDGSDRAEIEKRIADEGVTGRVILLGKKENPYPYMKECDLFVHPSLREGKAVSVIEAQILGKPVAITNFPTAHSQLKDGFDGVIVPLDTEGCAKGILELLRDTEKLEALKNNCRNTDYGSEKDMNTIYSFIE